MSEEPRKKGWGKTVLGWFVESEDERPADGASPEELIAKYGSGGAPFGSSTTTPLAVGASHDGKGNSAMLNPNMGTIWNMMIQIIPGKSIR